MKRFIRNSANYFLKSRIIIIPFNLFFGNRITIKLFNFLFENSPHIIQEVLTRLIIQPKFNFIYTIKLLNDKTIEVEIDKTYKPSFELSLSYRWHDRGLRDIERFLNDYYPITEYYLDIGSNHGLRSLYSLSINRPTILFEPNYKLNQFVNNLFARNSFSGYKIENKCLSNKSGKSKFYVSGSSYFSSLDIDQAKSDDLVSGINEIETELITLDEYYFSNMQNKKISIIKIDVEGHEFSVLKGSEKVLKTDKPSLMIEILPTNINKGELFLFLNNAGYRSFAILNKGNLKVHETSDLINGVNNYLFTMEDEIIKNLKF